MTRPADIYAAIERTFGKVDVVRWGDVDNTVLLRARDAKKRMDQAAELAEEVAIVRAPVVHVQPTFL